MKHPRKSRSSRRRAVLALAASSALLSYPASSHAQVVVNRTLGIDVSDWQDQNAQGPINWTTVHNPVSIGGGGKDFTFIRASRGGTTGTYNEQAGTGTLSHRYDDYAYYYNISNATAVGMFAGTYHFGRPDVAGNTGTDEANHMLQQASMYMKPGYMLPVFDLEAGSALTTAELSQFAVDFSNQIYASVGVRPMVYTGQSYAVSEVDSTVPAVYEHNWVARWPDQLYNHRIDVENIDPVPSPLTANVYGVWNPAFPNTPEPQPWKFWQYGSRGRVAGIGNNAVDVDLDVSHGDIEFVKDFLVPALWTTDSSGDWATQANWNSDNPIYSAGNPATGPAPRLPGTNGTTLGANDTVILERTSANPTITLSAGAYGIRKLIVRENFNLTGGTLNVGYIPKPATGGDIGSGLVTAQFSNTVTLSGSASFAAHTLQVDGAQTFNVNGGSLTFNTLDLQSHATTGAKIVMGGNVAITPLNGATTTIKSLGGLANIGSISLGGASRTFTVNDGAAAVDFQVNVPISSGSLVKAGAGTMHLNATNTYAGGTTVSAGTLIGTVASLPGNISNSATLVLEDINPATYSGVISGSGAFIKRGNGALTLNTAHTLTGPVTLERGNITLTGASGALASASSVSVNAMTLTLANAGANNNNRLSTGSLSLSAGAMTFSANSTTEAAGALTASTGASTVTLSGSGASSITFASLVRSTGATINFSGAGGTTSAIVTGGVAGAFIDQGTFASAVDYAVYDGSKIVRPMTAGAGANEYATSITSGRHVKLSASASGVASTSVETINLAGATVGVTLSPAETLTLSRGGIIKSGNGSAALAGGAGSLLAAPTNVEYVINTVGGSDTLTISVPVTGGSGLTKTGAGTLSLTGANSYNGVTTINGTGTLLTGPANLGAGGLVIADQGRFRTAASFDTGRSVNLPVGQGSIDTNGFDSTFFGNFSGTGGLTKFGAGTLVLNGPASGFSANTFIDGGTLAAGATNLGDGGRLNELEIGNGTLKTLGSINTARTISIVGGSAGVDTNGYDSTFTGVFTGFGGLTKSGAGTLTINSPDNTYNGSTTVAGGTLAVAPNHLASSGGLNFATGGRLRFLGNAVVSTPVALNTGGGAIDTDGYAVSLSGVISGSGAFTKSGFGPLALTANNTYNGAVTVNNGTLALSGPSGALTSATSYTVNGGAILKIDNSAGAGGNNNNRLAAVPITLNSGLIWMYGGPTTEAAGNLTAASGASQVVTAGSTTSNFNFGSLTRSPGATVNFLGASSTLRSSFTSGVTAGSFIDQGTFVSSNYAVYDATGYVRAMVTGAGDSDFTATYTASRHVKPTATATTAAISIYTLNLAGATVGATFSGAVTLSKGGLMKTGAGAGTISGAGSITTAAGTEYVISAVDAQDNLTVSVPITSGLRLTKSGLGVLTLNHTGNTYGGQTAIAQGTIKLGVAGTIPNTSDVIISTDAQLDMNAKNETVGNLTMYDGLVAGTGTLTLNGASPTITYTGVAEGGVISNTALALGTSAGTATFAIADGDADNDLTVSASLQDGTGAHAISKSGSGTLTLSGASTYTGPTDIVTGTLKINGSLAAASSVNVQTAGTLAGSGTINGAINLTGNGVVNFSSGALVSGAVNVTGGNWNGAGSVSGLVTSSSGNFLIGPGANLTANGGVSITGGTFAAAHANSTITGSVTYTSPLSSTWLGNIAGSGKTLTMNNLASVLTLTGVNTYTGQTTVSNGILRLTKSNNLAAASGVSTSSTGTVQLTGDITVANALTLGGAGIAGSSLTAPGSIGALDNLSGDNTWTGAITLSGTAGNGGDPLLNQISATSGTLTLTGIIQNGAGTSFAKTGNGDLVVAGGSPNTHTNLTRLFGGRMILEKNGAMGAAGSTSAASGNFFQLPGSASTLAFRSASSLNYSTYEVLNTDGTGAPGFGQIDNLSGNNTFAGSIAFGGPVLSGATLSSSISVTAGSLDVQGGLYARGTTGTRDLTKLGSGTFIVSGTPVASSNPSVVPLTNSTFHVNAGTIEHRGPTPSTNLLAGITTWNVNNGGTLKQTSGAFASTTVNVPTGGTLRYDGGAMSITNLNVNGGQALISQGGNKVLRTNTVSVTSGGKVNLADNDLIVDYTGTSSIGSWTGSIYTDITGLVAQGRNGGVWNGTGFTTSQSDATVGSGFTMLGVAEASDARSISGTQTDLWNGQTVDATSVLVMYTYGGDANLSGTVDVDDYGQIDFNSSVGGILTGWYNGDFDYNGSQDVDDYGIIDFVVNIQGPPLGTGAGMTVSTVPEPTMILPVALATFALRRRRKQK